jgi:hypothetical protein
LISVASVLEEVIPADQLYGPAEPIVWPVRRKENVSAIVEDNGLGLDEDDRSSGDDNPPIVRDGVLESCLR